MKPKQIPHLWDFCI